MQPPSSDSDYTAHRLFSSLNKLSIAFVGKKKEETIHTYRERKLQRKRLWGLDLQLKKLLIQKGLFCHLVVVSPVASSCAVLVILDSASG